MKNNESEEMYLETIMFLKGKKDCVRSVDIMQKLGYAKSSVSRAVNLLKSKDYISIASGGEIDFTKKGKEKAESVMERHRVLTLALKKFGASQELAEENACRIEHIISEDMFEIIKKAVDKNE